MQKPDSKSKSNVWDTPVEEVLDQVTDKKAMAAIAKEEVKQTKAEPKAKVKTIDASEPLYDLEGLMTDFPTAKELEKFVFDKTGHALELKGRSNKFKYETAMAVLNGEKPDEILLGNENPYLDKNDLIPVDPMKELPARPKELHDQWMVTQFLTKTFPHPDSDWKASGQKCDVIFRKYTNNTITYEIIGPVAPRAVGTRVNKFGKEVPEKYTWVDPRTGEQIIRTGSGMLTPIGTRLKAYMTKQKVNKTTAWDAWIDREFIMMGDNSNMLDNPWGEV
jgi:hypothetical protein